MTILAEDFVSALESFWTTTVGVVTLANSRGTGSADPTKLVVTSEVPTGSQQEVEAFVGCTENPLVGEVAPELWVRVETSGATFVKGYGLRLNMATATTATLALIYTDAGGDAVPLILATSATLTPAQYGSTADSVLQHMRLCVFERMTDSEAPERLETYLRGYLNNVDDNAPDVELVFKGGFSTSARPIWRDAGTYAIKFRSTTGFIDSWAGRDDYVGPTYDVLPGDRTTLSSMRSQVEEKLSIGGLTNYSAAVLNQVILEASRSIVNRLGDKALFMERFAQLDLTSGTNYTVTLPRDVHHIIAIYDGVSATPLPWSGLVMDERGRQVLSMSPNMSGRSVWLHYFGKIKPPTSDAHFLPVPSQYDECTLHAALMRIAGIENRADLLAWTTSMFEVTFQDLMHAMTVILRSRRTVMRVAGPRLRGRRFEYGNLGRASYEWS